MGTKYEIFRLDCFRQKYLFENYIFRPIFLPRDLLMQLTGTILAILFAQPRLRPTTLCMGRSRLPRTNQTEMWTSARSSSSSSVAPVGSSY